MNIKTREKITMRKFLNKLRRGANNLAIGAKCFAVRQTDLQ